MLLHYWSMVIQFAFTLYCLLYFCILRLLISIWDTMTTFAHLLIYCMILYSLFKLFNVEIETWTLREAEVSATF